MTVLDIISRDSLEIPEEWGSVIDSVVHERPVFVQRPEDDIVMLSVTVFNALLDSLKFHVSLASEDDGSVTGVVEELDLIENAATREGCVVSLLAAMKDYARDFYEEFAFWSSAPNRRPHVPYVLKILSSPDARLREDIVCRDGRI